MRTNERGSLLVGTLFVVAFVAVLSVPVMQVTSMENRVSMNQQLTVQAHYLAEAGLLHAQADIRQNGVSAFEGVSGDIGNGKYEAKLVNRSGNRYIVSRGKSANAVKVYEMRVSDLLADLGALTLTGNEPFVVQNNHNNVDITINGDVRSNGSFQSLSSNHPPQLTVTGQVALKGELTGAWGYNDERLVQNASEFDAEGFAQLMDICFFDKYASQRIVVDDSNIDTLLGQNKIYTVSGVVYWDTRTLSMNKINNATFNGDGTLIILGNLHFKEITGNLNVIVSGDLIQPTGGHNIHALRNVNGFIYCGGTLKTASTDIVNGAVVAKKMEVISSQKRINITYNSTFVSNAIPAEAAASFIQFANWREAIWP